MILSTLFRIQNSVIDFLLALIRPSYFWTSDGTIASFDLDWRVFWHSNFSFASIIMNTFQNAKPCHWFSACFNWTFKLLDKWRYNRIMWFRLEGVLAPPFLICFHDTFNSFRNAKSNPCFLLVLIRPLSYWRSNGTIISFDLEGASALPFIIRFSGAFKLFRNTKSCNWFSACFNQASKLLDKWRYNRIIWFERNVLAPSFLICFYDAFNFCRNAKFCR